MQKKIALLHRYPAECIKETNAAFPYLAAKGIDVLTFKKFDRLGSFGKFWKSLLWIFYAPLLVAGKGYDVVYCDDSYPFYPALVKLVSPRSKVVIRLGDLHLLYYCSGWVYELLHFFEEIGWTVADKIIVISETMAEALRKEGYSCEVVRDPVDPKDFPWVEGSTDSNTVMFHGVITKNKNLDMLIGAARLMPKTNFVIIGGGPDLYRLIQIAPDNVHFQGWVPFKEIYRRIASCTVGVAMRSENAGNDYVVTSPYIQYGIMGKPCLVSRRKVFGDYPWQFSTVTEMVDKLDDLLTAIVDRKGLRELFINHHSAEKIAGKIWQILTSL